ncbi:MAG: glycosyltransferase [Bacteroidia bacterium]|nr:glycosyltransferase [Bacteroidia bacterium]
MPKVRVLRLISRLNVGGPAHHVLLLTRQLNPQRYETLLVAGREPTGEHRAERWAKEYGASVRYLPHLEREPHWWKDILTVWYLWRLMRKWRPDIVHTHTAKAGALGRIAAWAAKVPVRVHTFHGHSLEGYFSPLKNWLYRQIERFLGRITHHLIAISETQRNDLVERFRIAPAHKVSVIPLGFDLRRLDTFDPMTVIQLREAWSRDKESLLLGWVGRMVPIKRVDRLLQAFAKVRETFPQARLVLIGEGSEREKWKKQAQELGITEDTFWVGLRWDIPNVLRALDAVILVSDNEGTPVTLIEALACGIPVAATPVGGVPDLLEGGKWGKLLQEPLADSLVEFLRELPQMRQRAQAAQPYIHERYNHTRLVADLSRLYDTLLPASAS